MWLTAGRFRRLAGFLLLLLTGAGATQAAVGQWSLLGPFGEGIVMMELDPLDPARLVLLDETGRAYRSADAGVNWTRSDVPLGTKGAITHLAAGPGAFYVTIRRGVTRQYVLRRSLDGGVTWERIADDEIPAVYEWRVVAADPAGSGTLYAASDEGAFRSVDGGASWTPASAGLGEYLLVQSLVVDPLDSSRLFLGAYTRSLDHAVFRSTDGGESWTRTSEGLPVGADDVVSDLEVDPTPPSHVYAVLGDELFRSMDGGASWQAVALPSQCSRLRPDLEIAPTRPSTLYLGCRTSWRSTDGGVTWEELSNGAGRVSVGPLVIDPRTPANLYGGMSTGGVLRSADGGDSWTAGRDGFEPIPVEHLLVDPRDPARLVIATELDYFRSSDRGMSWRGGLFGPITDIALDPEAPILYLTETFRSYGLNRSADGGETWARKFSDPFDFPQTVTVDPADPRYVYVGLGGLGSGILRSRDRGETWEKLAAGQVSALAVDPATRDVYYGTPEIRYQDGTTAAFVSRSTDRAETFTSVREGLPAADVESLAVDPATGVVYAGTGGFGLYRSPDRGMTWEATSVPGDVAAVLVDPAKTSTVYAGTGAGVFRSFDHGLSWRPLAPASLGGHRVHDLALDPADGDVLLAATDGGIYEIELVDDPTTLRLQDGRFEVEISWRDFAGAIGPGFLAATSTDALRSRDSAVVEFFGSDNWEVLIKVLDGTRINGRYWVFFAAATDVGYVVTVTDTLCGGVKTYRNPLGVAAPAVTDEEAFDDCAAPLPASCVEEEGVLCLGEGGRFQVVIEWFDFLGDSGRGRPVRISEPGLATSDDSGLFYFFGERNWELLVKVLDGCRLNGHYWVFGAATTDVEYTLRVTDTVTRTVRTYHNPLRVASPAITDVQAFATCGTD